MAASVLSHPGYKNLIKEIRAYCESQGWEFEGRFQEVTEAHLDSLVRKLMDGMGIQAQSVWVTYSDLFDAERIAKRVHSSMEKSDAAHEGVEDKTLDLASASRVLVSLGTVALCLADGRETLRTKSGLMKAMGIQTLMGEAAAQIAFALSEAAGAGASEVTIPGPARYCATEAMRRTMSNLESGAWSTGNPEQDDLIQRGITHDMNFLTDETYAESE